MLHLRERVLTKKRYNMWEKRKKRNKMGKRGYRELACSKESGSCRRSLCYIYPLQFLLLMARRRSGKRPVILAI